MLDAFIIEEIRRREKARRERERPSVELPLPSEDHPGKESETDGEKKPSVVIIDLMF